MIENIPDSVILIFVIGLGIMSYPVVSSMINNSKFREGMNDYTQVVKRMKKEDYSNFFNDAKKYNKSLTASYPAAILLGSEYRHDMNVMQKELEKLGCEHILIDPYAERGEQKQHCFVGAERVDPVAKEAFDRMMSFINKKTK